jgi:L,D-peptidoglycan transpeptidase YkuD (ErfK/YbiS/YcfS/YnhG family)
MILLTSMRFGFISLLFLAAAISRGATSNDSAGLPSDVRQLIVGTAENWSSTGGTLQRFERDSGGQWIKVGASVPVLFGKRGLAWGRGVLDPGATPAGAPQKREADGRTPAGAFALGVIYGNDPGLPPGGDYPYHQVTDRDAWPDDPANPFYNRHVEIDPAHPPAWFASQRMRTGDPAYRWRVEIRHNAEPFIEPGAGSATFFHVRRGPTRLTAGCTTMAETALRDLVVWLRAAAKPYYVLLPHDEYARLWRKWNLPAPGQK